MNPRFTDEDRRLIAARGATVGQVREQLLRFQAGFPCTVLERPCTLNDGIKRLTEQERQACLEVYEQAVSEGRVMKFVPASGAGSRMFQQLFAVKNKGIPATRETLTAFAAKGDEDARYGIRFFRNLPLFPFYGALQDAMGKQILDDALAAGQFAPILDQLLTRAGHDYPNLPKGMIPFHRYPDGVRTPFEEHLVEAGVYTRDRQGLARIHFTVSSEHLEAATRHITQVRTRYEDGERRLDIAFSIQKPATDTIAVKPDNAPFRDAEGRLVFRAGGHGALIENVNDLGGDIVFIKNIDNIVPDRLKAPVYHYKRVLGGYLASVQQQMFRHADALTSGKGGLEAVRTFCRQTLSIEPGPGLDSAPEERQRKYYLDLLNRPVRVCGMVRNTGEPGGGPFWVRADNGTLSIQIVESAQIDAKNETQQAIFKNATHFNPVDLVCGVADRFGKPYNLLAFRDPDAGFISSKSKDGRPLKAMEHPGLWNGAMARWNTVLVEAPGETFSPVKIIDDLLRPEHQPDDPAA